MWNRCTVLGEVCVWRFLNKPKLMAILVPEFNLLGSYTDRLKSYIAHSTSYPESWVMAQLTKHLLCICRSLSVDPEEHIESWWQLRTSVIIALLWWESRGTFWLQICSTEQWTTEGRFCFKQGGLTSEVVLWPPHMHCGKCMHTHTHTYTCARVHVHMHTCICNTQWDF